MLKKIQFWIKEQFQEFKNIPTTYKLVFLFFILFGTIIRAFGLFNLGFRYDTIETQYAWGKFAFENGYFGFWKDYPINLLYDYPPLSLIYEYILVSLTKPFDYNINVFVGLLKTVNWFVDILLSLGLLYLSQFTTPPKEKNSNQKWGFLLAALVYALPALWFVTGIWGQNDTLMAILAFLALFIVFKQSPDLTLDAKRHSIDNQELPVFYKDYNFWAGVFLAIAIEIKQQPILVMPFILLYYLFGKTWKDIYRLLFFISPFILMAVMGALIYSEDQKVIFQNFTNWQIISVLGFSILVIPMILLFLSRNQIGSWLKIRRWFLGFFIVSNIILIPNLFANYVRLAKVVFATVGRIDVVGNGASTFLTVIAKEPLGTKPFIQFSSFSLSISQLGLVIYLILMINLIWTYFDLNWKKVFSFNLQKIIPKSFTLQDFTLLFWVHASGYFLFFTKMHSRYLHLGIVLSFIVLAFNYPSYFKKAWLKISIFYSLFYFINQVGVYAANNKDPNWVNQLSDSFQVNPWTVSSIGLTVCFALMYTLILRYFADKNSKELSLVG